jgi:hypothetical protein
MSFLGAAIGTAFSAAMLHRGENTAGGQEAMHAVGLSLINPEMEAILLRQQTEVFHFLMIFSVIGCVTCFLRGTRAKQEKSA